MPSSFVKRIRVMLRDYDYIPVRPRSPAPNVVFKRSEPVGLSVDRIWKSRFFAATYVVGRGRGRTFFLLRLRASADFSFAFCPGGMKNACFFASLMISSVITLRLKRRSALSIDSPGLTLTTAIYLSSFLSIFSVCYLTHSERGWSSTQAKPRELLSQPAGFFPIVSAA